MRSRLLWLIAIVVLGAGCPKKTPPVTSGDPGVTSPATNAEVRWVLEAAARLQGATRVAVKGETFRSDCSGFVTACWYAAGRDLVDSEAKGTSGTAQIYDTLSREGRLVDPVHAHPGDIVFFHNTYDRNRNGVRDDRFSHVALVESVDADGTVHYAHFASGRVKRGVLNPRHPDDPIGPGKKPWNSYLRRGGGKVLAGQLFVGFGRP